MPNGKSLMTPTKKSANLTTVTATPSRAWGREGEPLSGLRTFYVASICRGGPTLGETIVIMSAPTTGCLGFPRTHLGPRLWQAPRKQKPVYDSEPLFSLSSPGALHLMSFLTHLGWCLLTFQHLNVLLRDILQSTTITHRNCSQRSSSEQ